MELGAVTCTARSARIQNPMPAPGGRSTTRAGTGMAQVPVEDALRAASLTPARFLGLEGERGLLAPGTRADFVALTDDQWPLQVPVADTPGLVD